MSDLFDAIARAGAEHATRVTTRRLTVHVRMPEDCTDWEAAKAVIQKLHPSARFGQGSRSARWFECSDACTEECGHPVTMLYTYKIYVRKS